MSHNYKIVKNICTKETFCFEFLSKSPLILFPLIDKKESLKKTSMVIEGLTEEVKEQNNENIVFVNSKVI